VWRSDDNVERVSQTPAANSLLETALLFLRLGATAFGGPAAHVAMMEREVVRRRGWLSHEQFLDYLGVTNLIPGPNSTELAMQIGQARHGWRGLLIAGASFILPAAAIVTAVGWAYVRFGSLPDAAGILAGIVPVVVAIVVQALWQLGRSAIKSVALAGLLVLSIVAIIAGVHELVVLAAAAIVAGVSAVGLARRETLSVAGAALAGGAGSTAAATALVAAEAAPFSLGTLFAVFFKIGAVLFGSGYVLLAFLRADFVERLGWLTERQLLDAVAVGQITPGPLFTTATFIGYLLGGAPGAVLATVAIFLPGFVFVGISGPLVPRIRRSRFASAALDGVNAASLALMAVVTWQLGRTALVSPVAILLFLASVLIIGRWPVSTTWLIGAGAGGGWLVAQFGL
jgi:chromate transporter